MATDTVKSTNITNLDATPVLRADSWRHGGLGKHYVGTVESTAAAAVGSTYRFFRVGSWMRPVGIGFSADALSAGALDIGLYRTAAEGGAAVHTSVLSQIVSTDTAKLNVSVLKPSADIANAEKRFWELLGLTSDPNLEYDVVATAITALGNAGTQTLNGTFTW